LAAAADAALSNVVGVGVAATGASADAASGSIADKAAVLTKKV